MGISKKQFTLAAKAGLTREQASRFIGTAGQEPSPTEAYDKVGQLLKGRTPGQAMKQVEPTLKKPEPTKTATAGIKPIEPEVSKAQPPEQPKVEATKPTDLIKPIDPATSATQPQGEIKDAATADKMIKETPTTPVALTKSLPKIAKSSDWQKWAKQDFTDEKLKDLLEAGISVETFRNLNPLYSGFEVGVLKDPNNGNVETSVNTRTGEIVAIKIRTPKETGERQERIKTHEIGHLIDYGYAMKIGGSLGANVNNRLVRDKDFVNFLDARGSYGTYFSRKLKNDPTFEEKIANEFLQFKEIIEPYNKLFSQNQTLVKESNAKLKELKAQIMKLPRDSEQFEKGRQDFIKLQNDLQSKQRVLIGRINNEQTKMDNFFDSKPGVKEFSDVIDALTGGQKANSWNLERIGSHSEEYWNRSDNIASEIWAEYITLKSLKDKTYFNKLKQYEPELVSQLDKLYEKAYNTLKGVK
jgi:hypothetical protein